MDWLTRAMVLLAVMWIGAAVLTVSYAGGMVALVLSRAMGS